MKICPKCNTEHTKSGTYCSRTCANSRSWSPEVNEQRSKKMIGKPSTKSEHDRFVAGQKASETRLQKYLATPFNELGMENRRRRVFEEQHYCCNKCNTSEWMGVKLPLELEHKDGNNQNNERENLEGLCPNCHSITDTWRGRNKPSRNGDNKMTDEALLKHLQESKNIRQGLLKAGMAAKGKNYERAKKLLGQ
jgi:hypothetical protein